MLMWAMSGRTRRKTPIWAAILPTLYACATAGTTIESEPARRAATAATTGEVTPYEVWFTLAQGARTTSVLDGIKGMHLPVALPLLPGDRYVLVQGDANVTLEPDRELLDREIGPRAERYLGPRKSGPFWDRWLQEYYADRVPVDVQVRRIGSWPDLACAGPPEVLGEPAPSAHPEPQSPPKNGTGPRVDAARAGARARKLPFVLLSFRGTDGYPAVHPVEISDAGPDGIVLTAADPSLIPPGGRRAGLLAHDYGKQLVALRTQQFTGWLTADEGSGRALYAPHTQQGFRAPGNKTLLLLANGFLAKRGLRKAIASGTLERLRETAAQRQISS